MPQRHILQNAYYFMLCVVAFFIPIATNFTSLSIIILAVCWSLLFSKTYLKQLFERQVLWIWLAFFLLYGVGYLYSHDKDQALFELQTKLSFLLLPVIIGAGPEIKESKLQNIFTGLVTGCAACAIFCLGRSAYVWISTGATEQFFYHTLVKDFDANAVYFSFYIYFALSILILYSWTNFLRSRLLQFILFVVLFAFLVLLSSKMLIVLFVVLVLPLFYKKISKRQVPKGLLVSGAAGIVAVCCIVAFTHNPIRQRYESVLQNSKLVLVQNQNQEFNNLTLRLFLWKMAIDDLNDNHLWLTGCGTGDVIEMQKKTIMAYNAKAHSLDKHPPLWNFNAHNMYLHMLLMLGIPGLIFLLTIVFLPFFLLRRTGHPRIFLAFHVAAAIFLFQEAAFQTSTFVIVYTFFTMIFYNLYYSRKEIKEGTSTS